MIDFFNGHQELVIMIVSSVVGYITGFKSRKNTEEAGELQNLKTLREIEKQLIADMKKSITEYQEIIKHQNEIIKEKDSILKELRLIVNKQKREINQLKK